MHEINEDLILQSRGVEALVSLLCAPAASRPHPAGYHPGHLSAGYHPSLLVDAALGALGNLVESNPNPNPNPDPNPDPKTLTLTLTLTLSLSLSLSLTLTLSPTRQSDRVPWHALALGRGTPDITPPIHPCIPSYAPFGSLNAGECPPPSCYLVITPIRRRGWPPSCPSSTTRYNQIAILIFRAISPSLMAISLSAPLCALLPP
jgi:hypothetical protein